MTFVLILGATAFLLSTLVSALLLHHNAARTAQNLARRERATAALPRYVGVWASSHG